MCTPKHSQTFFVPSSTIFHGISTRRSLSSTCSLPRRRQCTRARPSVQMQAKFQQKQDSQSSERPDDDSSIDKILPPPILPTLSTLTNRESTDKTSVASSTDDGSETEAPILPQPVTGEEQLAQMGPGLSQQQENVVVQFLKEVAEEFRAIEWTPFGRVVRLTFLVLFIIIVATAALYVVDGFLSRLAKSLFEDKIF